MGQITSLFVWKVIRQVSDNLDRDGLLRALGLDPAGPVDPSVMIKDSDYYAFLEQLVRTDPHGGDLPLRTGQSMLCDDYGAFGLAWKSAVTLRGSYDRAERYGRFLTSTTTYSVEETQDGAFMHLHREGERRLGLRVSNEASIASVASISEQVSSTPFVPQAVYFKHEAPGGPELHERHFGCPVYFEADRDALLVSTESLQGANKLGDASIVQFFDSHLEAELAKRQDDTSLGQRVRIQVSQSLSEGVPTISEIASRLGMSGRTLQRRLSDQGQSFQDLVDAARRQLAERLLQQTDYSLAEVSFLTGFSEQSAFTRAFKRWAGQTPRSYRLGAS